jgi:hypothetical protein
MARRDATLEKHEEHFSSADLRSWTREEKTQSFAFFCTCEFDGGTDNLP